MVGHPEKLDAALYEGGKQLADKCQFERTIPPGTNSCGYSRYLHSPCWYMDLKQGYFKWKM